MCGIAGVFAYGDRAPLVNREELRRSCERMGCRGPDGEGEWVSADGRAGLGHRRLSVIDLSSRGAQPMASADGRYVVSFNGEIYNYRALRACLEAEGRRFVTGSDTEVLLHLYAVKGEAMVHDLRGMFAFAIWDGERQGLFLARDTFGIKPLYVADDGATLRFASEVKSLLAGARGAIDTTPEAAGHVGFFLWGHIPDPYTLYRGIHALEAGTTLWVGREGRRARPFASVRDLVLEAERSAPSRAEAAESCAVVAAALRDSVRSHLVADVDVGVFLSAGLDSTTLAGLASESSPRLRTVTLGFDEYEGTEDDETVLAEIVANTYGTEHRTVRVTRSEFESELPRLLDRMDQPTTDGVNSYFVSRAAAQSGLKVAMSGLGGDELFAGYPSFREVPRIVNVLGRAGIPSTVGRGFRVVTAPLFKRFTSPKYAGLFEYGSDFGGAYFLRRGMFSPWELPDVLDPDLVARGWADLQLRDALATSISRVTTSQLRVSALEATWYMRNQLLRDTDWASMSHGLEVRVPFIDVCLWKSVLRLAAAGVRPDKQMMARSPHTPLPSAVLARAKTGFVVPTAQWCADRSGNGQRERGLRGWARQVYQSQNQAS